jgi:hypothetical protein
MFFIVNNNQQTGLWYVERSAGGVQNRFSPRIRTAHLEQVEPVEGVRGVRQTLGRLPQGFRPASRNFPVIPVSRLGSGGGGGMIGGHSS